MENVSKDKDSIIEQARKLKIVNETKIRNLKIKEEFDELRSAFIKYEDAINILANKYYRSPCTIEQIILNKK